LAQQAIGILAAYSLTRALGIMEMDADAQGDGELPMAGEFCSMIPGQRGHHSLRQAPHLRIRAPTTLSLPLPSTFTCITKRELRATKVAIWLFLAPLIRSPSQWPGRVDGNRAILETAHRLRIETASMIRPRVWPAVVAVSPRRMILRLRRCARSARSAVLRPPRT
jgi:hypothetical protein